MRHVGEPVISVPPMNSDPDVGTTSPLATRATVDFPAPFEPRSATAWPASTPRLTSKSAR